MSRPKLPNLSWRQLRIASAAAFAVLLVTAYIVRPADAKLDQPPARTVALAPSVTLLDEPHPSAHHALKSQAAAHQQAVEKARKAERERKARERAAAAAAAAQERARTQQAEQRANRSAQRQQTATRAAPAAVSGARNYAQSRLSSAQYQCLSNVVARESGWNHRAVNPSSGAYGLFQALPGSKMASAGSDWQINPLTQMRWGLSYMQARYGSPCGAWHFWLKNRWY
ncbi:transglycosylase SLT domain-containing protein [Streptomyces scabiei]|uniref:aggregation-promoting factor C-terminal-like domain-containing protein n=1 Tax=Streptomyces scabiei TaxID=1930 RepID=UPI003406B411